MNKTVLFSPVGGTDPISLANLYDGSMLHIARVYKPDEIILYMSREVLEKQEADDRYKYALHRLFELQGRKPALIREVERKELLEVQEFDFFYQEFREILNNELAHLDETDRLLINISSGTPAMKSGLLVLQTLLEYPAVLIQVVTPQRKMNVHVHDGYNNEDIWKLNEDNDPAKFVNRCREVGCPSLTKLKKEEIIKQQVLDYDYKAALSIAKTLPREETKEYLHLLEMGYERSLLNLARVGVLAKEAAFDCFPVKNEKNGDRDEFEYTLNLIIKERRGQFGDFILGITPIVVGMFEKVLRKQAGFELNHYTKKTANKTKKWNPTALHGTDVEKLLFSKVNNFNNNGPVYSSALIYLIDAFCVDSKVVSLCRDLRKVEEKVRNLVAHQIVSITEQKIKKETGFTSTEIIQRMKKLFLYAGISTPKEAWDSYDHLNEEIIRRMDS